MPEWTSEQKKAISHKGNFCVLSAAAGSGKTTVLVERAIQLLLDRENPVSADKLLIVTFSNASRAEFRKRIEDRINKEIKDNPQDRYIKSQKIKLQNADISTIHAFCIKLARENFELLGISPDFTICDSTQSADIHRLAINIATNDGYSSAKFKELVSFYGKSRSDDDIREFLFKMNEFFSALPEPLKRAEHMKKNYSKYTDMLTCPAYFEIMSNIQSQARYLVSLSQTMNDLYNSCASEGYEDGIALAITSAKKVVKRAAEADVLLLKEALSGCFNGLGTVKRGTKTDTSELIKDGIYGEYKAVAQDILDQLEYIDSTRYQSQLNATKEYVDILFEVYEKYQLRLKEIKISRKMFEFYDFEHFAIQLLLDGDGKPTPLCQNLKNHYEYIMEDEYQDTSFVQDKIFASIARENMSNLYVVGDVKQSIYGFRKASPEIIIAKRKLSESDPDKYTTLYMPSNFRSDYGIIEGVNYIFKRLMTSECGGINYNNNEALSTTKPADNIKNVQLRLYDDNEAENTARYISKLIKSGYEIVEKGCKRPVEAGDFCILLRNSKKMNEFRTALEKLGIDAFVRDSELVLKKPEIRNIIHLLKVIRNPQQEVYLTATMFGDIFRFSIDDIFKIKRTDRTQNLYKSLSLSQNSDARKMLELLKDFTYMADVLSPDKLIDYICRKTGYYVRISFTQDGAEKRENIRWFIDFAKNYATTHQGADLSAFLRNVDRYIEEDKPVSTDASAPQGAVSIMTMHSSKGLEFPVCIVAGLATVFNKRDVNSKLLLNQELGIGMYANRQFGYNNSTLNIAAIRNKIRQNSADEEMRLLYVALTRAKNLLVMSRQYERNFSEKSVKKALAISSGTVNPIFLRGCTSPILWIISALSGNIAFHQEFGYIANDDPSIPSCFDIQLHADMQECAEENISQQNYILDADMDRINENLRYQYPHILRTKLPIKMSVSEISKSNSFSLAKPDFIKGNKVSSSEKGTAMHRFAQHVNIKNARENLDAEIERLSAIGLIEPQLLNREQIEKFIHSDIADMILASPVVYTERNFRAPYRADLALGDNEYAGEEVLVQGIMDCVLQDGDKIVIIDYKTDYITDIHQLRDRYTKQLDLYRHGAKSLFNTDDIRCILYSFHLDQTIEI